jgi:hypothetical protein
LKSLILNNARGLECLSEAEQFAEQLSLLVTAGALQVHAPSRKHQNVKKDISMLV